MKMDKMAKEILTHLKYILISILLLISNPIFGQESNVSLISDSIDYNKLSGELIATGNVKVLYDNTILSADKIKYDSKMSVWYQIRKNTLHSNIPCRWMVPVFAKRYEWAALLGIAWGCDNSLRLATALHYTARRAVLLVGMVGRVSEYSRCRC